MREHSGFGLRQRSQHSLPPVPVYRLVFRWLNDLEQLIKAPWLQRVNLKGTPVTEAGVKTLANQLPFLRIEWDGGVIQGKKREPDPKEKKKR